jgi:hypothetical protein
MCNDKLFKDTSVLDPGLGRQRAKMTHKNRKSKYISFFEGLDILV